ncbi:MAG: phosphonate ABC transporter, permease protein PhnE [Streptosporangiales bacterium]|nr:phosphonate ABC transporter, permease protein PhnE [Streptosporangiales bacterium]
MSNPAQALAPPLTIRRLVTPATVLTFVLLAVGSLAYLDFDFSRLGQSIAAVPDIAARALPPDPGVLPQALATAVQTLWMAVLGTALATVAAAAVALLAARPTSPHPALRLVARAVVVVCRVIPDIAFALFFVVSTGIGPLPGVLALALHSIGMLGRLFTEAIERIDESALEAVAAGGATWTQRVTAGVLPQVVPAFLAATLYRLDVNFRGATLLGFVGAGGIGTLLQRYGSAPTTYAQLAMVVIVIMACCLLFEAVSVVLRRTVGGLLLDRPGRAADTVVADVPRFDRSRLVVPWTSARRRVWALGTGTALVVLVAAVLVDIHVGDLVQLTRGFGGTVLEFLPTAATLLDAPAGVPFWVELVQGVGQTLALAFVAILLCVAFGVPWGMLAAANISPHRLLYVPARAGLVLARSVPESAVAVLAIAVFGLEPVTAVLVLALAVCPFLAKLVADVAEEIQPGPREGVFAAGASSPQEFVVGVWGQVVPAVTSSILYAFDTMVRAIPILGIIGVGALGYTMSRAFSLLEYDLVGAIIAALFVVILAIQLVSDRLRAALS